MPEVSDSSENILALVPRFGTSMLYLCIRNKNIMS